MGLEASTTISGLVVTNPASGDLLSQADDHLRLLKSVLKAQFPGASGTGFASPITASEVELNFVDGVTSPIQTQLNALVAADVTHTANITALGTSKAASGANTDITSLNAPALGAATATTQAATDSTTKVATTAQVQSALAQSNSSIAILSEKQANGVDGGASSAATLNLRTLNTVDHNGITGLSLNVVSGVITLPIGTYAVSAKGVTYSTGASLLRWYFNGVPYNPGNGLAVYTAGATNVSAVSESEMVLVVTAISTLQLYQYTSSAQAADGMGHAVNMGVQEVYAQVKIQKLS